MISYAGGPRSETSVCTLPGAANVREPGGRLNTCADHRHHRPGVRGPVKTWTGCHTRVWRHSAPEYEQVPRKVYDRQRGHGKRQSSRRTQEARRADQVSHRACRTEADLFPAERNRPGFPRRFRRTVHGKRRQAAPDGAWHTAQATGDLPISAPARGTGGTTASSAEFDAGYRRAGRPRTSRDAGDHAIAFVRLRSRQSASARPHRDAAVSAPAAPAVSGSASGASRASARPAPAVLMEPPGRNLRHRRFGGGCGDYFRGATSNSKAQRKYRAAQRGGGAGGHCLGVIAAAVLRARRPASFETLGTVFMPAEKENQQQSRRGSRSAVPQAPSVK